MTPSPGTVGFPAEWKPDCRIAEVRHLVASDARRPLCCDEALTRHAPTLCGSQAFTDWPGGWSWETWPKCSDCQRCVGAQ